MNDQQHFNYETPQLKPGFRWPPDWLRRFLVALIAAPIMLLVTLETARRTQSNAVSYMQSGGFVNFSVRDLQNAVDKYTRDTGAAPAALTDVPEIQKRAADDPAYLIDPWRVPYLLKSINGKPTVISYGRDKAPGGQGLDSDITVSTPYGSELVTMEQFIHNTNLKPVIFICVGNALLIALLAFAGTTDTREPRGLRTLLWKLSIRAIMALFVASMIAGVHAPSGH